MSRVIKKQIIEERINYVNRLEKELKRIRKAQSDLGYIQLPRPIRDGWFKTLRLRDDIKRTKKAKIYQEVLEAILVEIWGREKKYADKRWKKYFLRNGISFQRPGIRRLNVKEFSKLSSKAQRCFIKRKLKGYRTHRVVYVCIIPKYYFQLTYRRAYITELRIISPILESREQEINEILSQSALRRYSQYINYSYKPYHNPIKQERRNIKLMLSQSMKSYTSNVS